MRKNMQFAGALAAAAITLFSTSLAQASPCDDALTRFVRILSQDLKMGRVDKEVYAAAIEELRPINETCKAGKDAAAIAAMNAVKTRHGYPVGL